VRDRADLKCAGIVDQYVERTMGIECGANQLGRRVRRAEISAKYPCARNLAR
jgi:hypothetical protein